MLDLDIVTSCKVFKGFFGLKHLFSGSSFLEMAVKKFAMVIHPESTVFVLAIGGSTSLKGNMPANAGDHLVNGNHVAR